MFFYIGLGRYLVYDLLRGPFLLYVDKLNTQDISFKKNSLSFRPFQANVLFLINQCDVYSE